MSTRRDHRTSPSDAPSTLSRHLSRQISRLTTDKNSKFFQITPTTLGPNDHMWNVWILLCKKNARPEMLRTNGLELRTRVVRLYKELYFMGKDYPLGAEYYRTRLKKAFAANRDIHDAEKIEQLIKRGEFVKKEIETLYFLKKYRYLKQQYYDEDESVNAAVQKLEKLADEIPNKSNN